MAPSLVAAPALTLAVLLAAMAVAGIVPFGDHPFFARDGAIQYVGFFGWYHEVLTGDASLCYSFAKGLGGGTFDLFAYYLSSPLSLLAAFFAPPDSPLLFSMLVPLKLCLAALSCAFFLLRRFEGRGVALGVIGCAYALGSYSFVDGLNVMWLDGMALAPLVALGASRLARGGRPMLLYASASLAIVCNWYIGYMVCLFAIACFFAELAAAPRSPRMPRARRRLARFAAALGLAVGTGLVVLLPAALAQLSSGGLGDDSGILSAFTTGSILLNPLDLVRSLVDVDRPFGGGTNAVRLPVLLLALAAAGLLLPGGRRFRAAWGVLLAVLVAAVLVVPFGTVWTGFVRGESYNPRFFFLVTLVLCALAGRALAALRQGAARRVAAALRPVLALALAAVVGADALFISACCLSSTDLNGYAANSATQYTRYLAALEEVHEQARAERAAEGDPFFRMENAATTSIDAMRVTPPTSAVDRLSSYMPTGEYLALGDSSLSHYSSTANGNAKSLLGHLGYSTLPGTRGVTSYHSPLLLTDAILGVDALVSDDRPVGFEGPVAELDLPDPYGEAAAYMAERSLPLGFGATTSDASLAWTDDPFENQARWVASLAGAPSEGAVSLYRETLISSPSFSESDGPSLTWTVTASQAGPLYAWVPYAPAGTEVRCDGAFLQTTRSYEYDTNLMYLGDVSAGQTVTVTLRGAGIAEGAAALDVRSLDVSAVDAALQALGRDPLQLTEVHDGSLAGTIEASEDEDLVLTVPYERGWTVRVDGAEVEPRNRDGLIAVPLSAGAHSVEATYATPGLSAGIAISVASLAIALVWFVRIRPARPLRASR